jgi:hypothetical protein
MHNCRLYLRLIKWGFSNSFVIVRVVIAVKVIRIERRLQSFIINPKAIPTAGGCSVSVVTKIIEVIPTHRALEINNSR